MEVYALVGPSGTGKSHHATDLADEMQISFIIDDGLLIHNGRKLAGTSSKSEPTMVAAVKRAVFLDKNHAEEVKKALSKFRVKRILILGTSEHMIDRIVGALNLPPVKQVTDLLRGCKRDSGNTSFCDDVSGILFYNVSIRQRFFRPD